MLKGLFLLGFQAVVFGTQVGVEDGGVVNVCGKELFGGEVYCAL